MNPHCDLELSNPKFATQHWLVIMHHLPSLGAKGSELLEPSLWPWPWRHQSEIVTQHSGSWWCTTYTKSVWLQKVSTNIQEMRKKQVYSVLTIWPWPRIVTLTLKSRTQPFCITLWVMMTHHHTKFSCTQFSGSEDIFRRTNWGVTHRHTDRRTSLFQQTPHKLSYVWGRGGINTYRREVVWCTPQPAPSPDLTTWPQKPQRRVVFRECQNSTWLNFKFFFLLLF